MTSTFVPYSQVAPKTTSLHELHAELDRVRETYGRGSSQGLEAWNHLSEEAARQGAPLDGLSRRTENEVERFFAFTISGVDGHVYWAGPSTFVRNDGRRRKPLRWWWEHTHETLGLTDAILVVCGERNCVNPEHAVKEDRSARHRIYTDDQMLGRLQVEALRLGHAPSKNWWEAQHLQPTHSSYTHRFGSWLLAIAAAGLEPVPAAPTATQEDCLRSLRLARDVLGRWPLTKEFDRPVVKASLRAAGLPVQRGTITKRLAAASWADAIRKAQAA